MSRRSLTVAGTFVVTAYLLYIEGTAVSRSSGFTVMDLFVFVLVVGVLSGLAMAEHITRNNSLALVLITIGAFQFGFFGSAVTPSTINFVLVPVTVFFFAYLLTCRFIRLVHQYDNKSVASNDFRGD